MMPPRSAGPARWLLLGGLAGALAGCLSPLSLNHTVLAYDEVATDTLSKQLLLNIARAHQHLPIHFTGVSSIAATFNFQFNAGATPAVTGSQGSLLTPVFGGSASENPTISILPIEGEEFTRRLLAPFDESRMTLLLRQGYDIDLLLRLVAGELRVERDGKEIALHNRPADPVGYALFRRAVLHLSTIQDRNALYVEPLIFQRAWRIPSEAMTADTLAALDKENTAGEYDAALREYKLSKQKVGHILITNYDPGTLAEEERARLNGEADRGLPHEIMVDIRAGYPGGEYPFKGKFRLRSFHAVLNFLGRTIADEPEYDVARDARTPAVSENPAYAMEVVEGRSRPEAADMAVELNGRHYALRPETGYQWNREAFRLLYQLFQMTVTNLPQIGAPGITIAK
jgi:hypothetical protein